MIKLQCLKINNLLIYAVSYPRELVKYVWDQEGPPPINPEMRMLRHRVAINKGKSEIHMLNSE